MSSQYDSFGDVFVGCLECQMSVLWYKFMSDRRPACPFCDEWPGICVDSLCGWEGDWFPHFYKFHGHSCTWVEQESDTFGQRV